MLSVSLVVGLTKAEKLVYSTADLFRLERALKKSCHPWSRSSVLWNANYQESEEDFGVWVWKVTIGGPAWTRTRDLSLIRTAL